MTKTKWLIPGIILAVIAVIGLTIGGTYNSLVSDREKVRTAFSNVQTQYQRRADLIPNLVSTVKGASNFEQETLQQVVDARAKATSITVSLDNAQQVEDYAASQQAVTSSLGRLIAVAENYPDLKASEAYRDLLVQLEGTENRIQVARSDFNEAVRPYNTRIQSFPTNVIAGMFGFTRIELFTADEGASAAPTVDFGTGTAAP